MKNKLCFSLAKTVIFQKIPNVCDIILCHLLVFHGTCLAHPSALANLSASISLFSTVHEYLLLPSYSISQDFILKFSEECDYWEKKGNKNMWKVQFIVKICIS